MSKTKIEWTDYRWNPVRGCTKVSEGCRNCYAARMAARFAGPGGPFEGLAEMTEHGPRWTGEIRLVWEVLYKPLRWKKPRRIFVNSMSDLFHEAVPDDFIEEIFRVMSVADHHIYQVLTKRPERMLKWMKYYCWNLSHAPHIWLGVSVENQKAAEERIPVLLQVPAAVRFVSCEPLLGRVDLRRWIDRRYLCGCGGLCDPTELCPMAHNAKRIDWVIVGGESGPGARPMHPDWVRSIRDQCQASGVPFFFKQWGDWKLVWMTGEYRWMRVGKKDAGRLLDGREWNEMPEVRT